MAKLSSINMLFGEISYAEPDYKVSLNELDESKSRYDYLWEKLSSKNKIVRDATGKNINTQLDTNKNLVPCELINNKIVLSPSSSGGEGDNVIIVDSFHLVDSNTSDFKFDKQVAPPVCFPVQLAIGTVNNIMIVNGDGGRTTA